MTKKKFRTLPLNWFGGKGQMVSKLLKYIPDHDIYVEVFGGGAALLFNKDPVTIEIYNDLNDGLVNFFRILRDKKNFDELYHMLKMTPYSRSIFYEAKEKVENEWDSLSDVEKAYYFMIKYRFSFSGLGNTWSYSTTSSRRGMSLRASAFNNMIDIFEKFHERVKRIQVDQRHFREIFKAYDSEDTFFYCDPPYVHGTRKSGEYEYEMSNEDHEELVDILLNVKGKVMLSGYENDIYKKLEDNGWNVVKFETYSNIHNKAGKIKNESKRTEVIWMNYGE